MPRSSRRYLLTTCVTLAAGSVAAGAMAIAAAPAAGALAPAGHTHAHARGHASPGLVLPTLPITLPTLPITLPSILPTSIIPTGTSPATSCSGVLVPVLGICLPIPVGGLPTDPSALCSLVLTTISLPAAEASAICSALDASSGAPTLPTGASSATPNTFPNNETAQQVVITDPFEQLYSAAGGATVTINGASTIDSISTPDLDDASGTITASFDLADPTPATPGAYTLTIAPVDPSGLTTVLSALGLPALSADTVPVTITAPTGPDAVTNLTAKPTAGTTASLTWDPPTAATPAVTGYSILVSSKTTATATDPGVTVTQTGTTPSASITGLTAGTKYYVTVEATSASGNGASAVTTFTTPYTTSLTLSGTPAKPEGGSSVAFSGQLTRKVGSSSQPLAGKSVGIYVKYAGAAKFAVAGKLMTTKADGTYSEDFTPTKAGVYVALFLGDAASGTSPGDSFSYTLGLTETPQPDVTLTATGKAHGKKFTMSVKGTVTPAEAGKKVIVYRTVSGSQVKFGKAHMDASGKYSFVKKRLGAGTYKLQAKIKSHFGNAAATSPFFSVRAG